MFLDNDSKYQALVDRDPTAEGKFVYCVRSTNIVCRPTCSSRLANRENVIFCDNVRQAIEYSYRPCKRCKPEVELGWNNQREVIMNACKEIRDMAVNGKKLDIDSIIFDLKVSKWYFYRTFKLYVLTTPRKYYIKCLTEDQNVTVPIIQTKRNVLKQRKLLDKTLQENDMYLKSLIDPCI